MFMESTPEGQTELAFQPGLTWRSILAMLMAALIFLPVSIYLWFAVGSSVSVAATYVTVILFSAMARIYGSKLSKQELFIIYSTVGGIGGAMPLYYWLIFRSYFVNNPLSLEFRLAGIPVRNYVPVWLSPPASSVAHQLRTLLHPDWAFALGVNLLFSALSMLAEISLGIVFSYLYIEVEPLPFPFAQIDAAMISTLQERRSNDMFYFMLSLTAGAIYGTLLYLAPILVGPQAQVIPYPWVDFTSLTYTILPGAIIGLATDVVSFLYGMVLPPSLTFSIMLGSFTTWIIGNTLTLTVFKDFSPEWVREYTPGMNIFLILQRAGLRLWLSFFMGLSFGLAIFTFLTIRKKLVESLRSLSRLGHVKGGPGYPSPKVLFGLFFLAMTLSFVLYVFLVPGIPIWLPFLVSVTLSFVIASVGARVYGELGLTFSSDFVYNMWKTMIYFSPYEGYAAWIFTPAIAGFSTPWYVNSTRVAYATQTRPMDFYKAVLVSFLLVTVFGLVFTEFFWRAVAPIPSFVFPYVMGIWPNYVISDCLFATRQIAIKLDQILMGIGVGTLGSLGVFALSKLGIPLNPLGFIGGMYSTPQYTIMVFAMSMLSKHLISRVLGKERWESIRGIVLAGFLAGVGITVAVGTASILISRASWIWPW